MAKLGRILLIILLVLLALVIAAAVAVETRWARGLLEDQLSQRMDGREVNIGDLEIDWGFPVGIQASDVQIANADWAEHEQLLNVDMVDVTLKVGPLLRGQVALGTVDLQQPTVHLARREDGTTNWEALTPEEKEVKEPPVQPDIIRIRNGEFTYRDEALDANITVTVETEESDEQRQLQITGRGNFQGETFQLDAQGGAPSEALEQGTRYPVTINARLGDMRLGFEGESLNVYRLEALHGTLELEAPDQEQLTSLVSLLDQPGLAIPPVDLQAQLSHEDKRWALTDIQASAGSSRLSGSLAARMTDTPRFEVDLDAERIDLNEFGIPEILASDQQSEGDQRRAETSENQESPDNSQPEEDLSWDERMAQRLAPLREYSADVDLSVDELLFGEARYEDLALQGELENGRLQIERLHATQGEGSLAATGWIEALENSMRANIDAEFSQLDLGQALSPLGMGQLGVLTGQIHAGFDGQSVRVDNTQVDYSAPVQDLQLNASITARDIPDTEAPGMHLEGEGRRNGQPFSFNLNVGPLLDLAAPDQPYPVQGSFSAGEAQASINGTLTQPLELDGADLRFDASAPNPAELNALTGLTLPELSNVEASGRLRLEDDLLRVNDLRAEVGQSDINGDVRLRLSDKPMLWATLYSQQLNVNDLLAMTEDEPEQSERVFSDDPLNFDILGTLDAELRYQAENLVINKVPATGVRLEASLDDQVLQVTPLSMGLGDGTVRVDGRLDTRGAAAQGNFDVEIQQVNLSPLLRSAELPEIAQDTAGILGGKGELRFEGKSIAQIMASLDGILELAMSGGYLDMLVVEIAGLDVGESLIAALSDDDRVPLRCTYVRLAAEQGVAEFEQFYINTTDTNFTGGGTIDLAKETLDLVIKSHPKDFSLVSVETPVYLQGTLANPSVSVDTGGLLARGAASVVGALVAPPLAILPWIEPGDGEGVGPGCRQALQEFEKPSE